MALATHTPAAELAMAVGPSPTSISAVTRFAAGSIRETVPSWPLATQTAPSANVTARGPFPTAREATVRPVAGSTRVTLPTESAIHTAASVAAMPLGDAATA